MAHLKRQQMPKNWPVPRKGTTFIVKPLSGELPILIALRDMLNLAQNKKEVKKSLRERNILLNKKEVIEEKVGLNLFDVLTLVPSKQNYRLELSEKGKFVLNEINEADSKKKISKIVNKRTLKGKKTQINFLDGSNLLSEEKCVVGASVIIDLEKKKIIKCLDFKKGANVVIIAGKHAGKKGKIEEINTEGKLAEIKTEKEKINVLTKQIVVIE